LACRACAHVCVECLIATVMHGGCRACAHVCVCWMFDLCHPPPVHVFSILVLLLFCFALVCFFFRCWTWWNHEQFMFFLWKSMLAFVCLVEQNWTKRSTAKMSSLAILMEMVSSRKASICLWQLGHQICSALLAVFNAHSYFALWRCHRVWCNNRTPCFFSSWKPEVCMQHYAWASVHSFVCLFVSCTKNESWRGGTLFAFFFLFLSLFVPRVQRACVQHLQL